MTFPLNQMNETDQVSIAALNNRPINLAFVLIAHQLILIPLYFFLPFWIFTFNCLVLGLVYFSKIKNRFKVIRWLKMLLTFIAVAGVFASFHRLSGRDAGVSLIAIMYGLKIIEIESKRDVYILMLLGFFLLLAGFLFSKSPLIAFYQFIPVVAILYALQTIHLINPIKFNRTSNTSRYSIFNILFNESSRYLFKQLLKYLLLAMPIMLILFLFFPRLSGPIWQMPGSKNASTGLSNSMSPGEISDLQLSDKVAFRVKFEGNEPQGSSLYWRMLVLNDFDGLTWSHLKSDKSDSWHIEDNRKSQSVNAIENDFSNISLKNHYKYEVVLEPTQQKWLTYLDRPTKVASNVTVLKDFSVANNNRLFRRTKYQGESQTDLVLSSKLSDEDRKINTRLPDNYNPRSKNWAQEQREKVASDDLFIQLVLQQINQQEYFYTLSPPIMEEDTVDSFWFDQTKGFCEHYAGALTFMARAADIPARVVIGYQGAEKNILSDYWIVRNLNAHAWVEIWFEGKGWVRIDPTAAIAKHRIEEQLLTDYTQRESLFESFNFDLVELENIGLAKQLGFWFDQVNSGWNDWFLEYNQSLQKKLLMNLGLANFSREQIAFFSLFIIVCFLLLININWRVKQGKSNILTKAVNRLTRKLSKHGIIILSNDCLEDILRQLKINDLSSTKLSKSTTYQLKILLQDYQKMRYAQNNCSIEEQKAFYKRVKKLKLTRSVV